MKKFLAATKIKENPEISENIKDFPYEVLSRNLVGIDMDIEETRSTFEENALIKAKEINRITGEIVMADDSGLEVDFLNGAPGIYSARFAGENATDEEKNIKLLDLLKDVPFDKRAARFVCVIAVVFPDKSSFTVKGTCEGYIWHKPEGENGFGYDPIFYVPEYQMTTAQMASEMKHKISHRGKALRLMVDELRKRSI